MADYSGILKELLQQLKTKNIRDPEIRRILQKVEKNIATHLDGQQYAIRVGQNTADVIITNLLDGLEIPEYYKLEATIMPLLKNDHQLINELAARIQENLYEKANLGLNPIRPALEADRAEDLINAISDAKNITKARNLVDSSLVDLVQHFDDIFIKENAEKQYKSGMTPKVVRNLTGSACEWCVALAGRYSYPGVPLSVYKRHSNCRCIVTYDPGDGRRQNVHSKRWMDDAEIDEIERRQKNAEIEKEVSSREINDDYWSKEQIQAREESQRLIKEGRYRLDLKHDKYLEHIEGTDQYQRRIANNNNPSILLISEEEAQEIIDLYAGHGYVQIGNGQVRKYIEYVSLDKNIGAHFDARDPSKPILTNRIMIIKSKGGTHIVPVKSNQGE